jgi:hypothetical protein
MNNNLNINWLFSKQFKAATATLLLAASMLMFMGLPIAPSAQAASTGTLTLSSSQIFGNASLSITVSDSDIGVQELKDTYNPSVVIEFTNATKTYQINSTQNTGGSWVAYITNSMWVRQSCSAATTDNLNISASDIVGSTGDAVTYPTNKRPNAGFATEGNGANGVITGTCAVHYVKNHHLLSGVPNTRTYSNLTFVGADGASGDIAEFGYIQAFNMTRGNTYTITYRDASDSDGAVKEVSTTFTYKEQKASLYNTEEKQTTVTPGATLRLYLSNPDANQDPTEKESFLVTNNTNQFKATIVTSSNATLQNLTNKTLNYFGAAAHQGHKSTVFRLNFTETGVNTGIFKCSNVSPASASSVCLEMENFHYNTSAVGNTAATGADGAHITHGQKNMEPHSRQ